MKTTTTKHPRAEVCKAPPHVKSRFPPGCTCSRTRHTHSCRYFICFCFNTEAISESIPAEWCRRANPSTGCLRTPYLEFLEVRCTCLPIGPLLNSDTSGHLFFRGRRIGFDCFLSLFYIFRLCFIYIYMANTNTVFTLTYFNLVFLHMKMYKTVQL